MKLSLQLFGIFVNYYKNILNCIMKIETPRKKNIFK